MASGVSLPTCGESAVFLHACSPFGRPSIDTGVGRPWCKPVLVEVAAMWAASLCLVVGVRSHLQRLAGELATPHRFLRSSRSGRLARYGHSMKGPRASGG